MKGDNEDETTGIEIVKRAIEEPLRQIVANAGKEGAVIVQKVKEGRATSVTTLVRTVSRICARLV